MLRNLIFFLVFLSGLLSFSQNNGNKIDSLILQLNEAKEVDKIEVLLELSDLKILEEEGLSFANQAYELAKKLKDQKAEIDALNAIGKYYYANYQEDRALEYFLLSLSLAEKINDLKLMGKVFRNIGQTYYYLDSFDKSYDYTLRTLDISIRTSDRLLEADALIDLGTLAFNRGNSDSAQVYMNKALKIRMEEKAMLDVALAYNRLGNLYFEIGESSKAIESFNKEIEIKEAQGDFGGLVIACYNLGRVHFRLGNYQLSLEQFQKSLSIAEKINNLHIVARSCNEIGMVYENLSQSALAVRDNEANFKKALEFHERALKLYQEDNKLPLVGQSLNNIANTHSRLAINQFVAQYGEAWEDSLQKISTNVILSTFGKTFEYYNQALEIFEQIEDKKEIANVNINLGCHYNWARNWTQAKKHINIGLNLAKELNSPLEISNALFTLGETSFRQGNFELAERYLLESAKIAEDLELKDVLRHSYNKLSKVYEQQGNMAKALDFFRKSTLIKDQIFSEQSQKAITEMQTKYETEKKEQEIKLLNNQQELQTSIIQRQKLTIGITIGGLLVILAFAVLLINMVRQKQKANRILEEKNELISHQKQEITDSIRYASRIQNAVLPSSNLLSESLRDHFVLFLPRDIVSGDFYWFTKRNNKMVIVAADCTGHGVPGAFMSMLGVSFLYEIVSKENIMQPAEILNALRELVKVTLSQTGKMNEQKDGMDISLSVLDLQNMHLQWAGAYNPLYLVRKGELTEYKADKMPVAIHINDYKPFTNNEIDLQPGDCFYMSSDGFADQFGGEEGRKFMSKRFKELLININNLTMEEQKEALLQAHLQWRTGYEQIDDVVVFGVKV